MNIRLTPIAALLTTLFSLNAAVIAAEEATALGEVTVTGTREARLLSETPQTIHSVKAETIRDQRPSHPSQVMNQMPGVWVSNLSGEGHSTSIRQPLTTAALYLYLEDGIPTRPTGFFNHNSLYEINVPQSGGIEVSKGPGTALYGSDAIGGSINVLTRTPPRQAEFEASAEVGSYGWKRSLISGGDTVGDNAWRASLNLTQNDGWQNNSGYERQSGNFRWDSALGNDAILKTIVAVSSINQQHVGNLTTREYNEAPRSNNVSFSYRKVDAFRLSTTYEKESENSLLSITPYIRDNRMEIVPSWSVSYDPSRYVSESQSFGFLSKYRRDFEPLQARVIVGLDYDLSPGSRDEDSIRLNQTINALGGKTYALNSAAPVKIYKYDVVYRSISPYLHGEISPFEKLRITAGLRYDDMQYDYTNTFNGGAASATQGVGGPFPAGGYYGHAASTKIGYSHFSPKLAINYAFDKNLNAYASYSNSFRTPSESQVFRGSRESTALKAQTAAESLLQLKPVIVDSYELGLRGKQGRFNYEVAAYYMTKKDDIVSYTDPATNQRRVVNAGQTEHRGVELGLGAQLAEAWRADVSLSRAQHRYEKWVVNGTSDYSGKDMEAAPKIMANTRLTYHPASLNGGRVQLEWVKLGSYWQDQANTLKYAGHDLFHLRANYPVTRQFEVWGGINNLLDKRYAETAGVDGSIASYTAGLPRIFTIGIQGKW